MSRGMRWAEYVECTEMKRNAYRVLVGKPEGKRPPGRPRNIRGCNCFARPERGQRNIV
jgi:hypothetical protein